MIRAVEVVYNENRLLNWCNLENLYRFQTDGKELRSKDTIFIINDFNFSVTCLLQAEQ